MADDRFSDKFVQPTVSDAATKLSLANKIAQRFYEKSGRYPKGYKPKETEPFKMDLPSTLSRIRGGAGTPEDTLYVQKQLSEEALGGTKKPSGLRDLVGDTIDERAALRQKNPESYKYAPALAHLDSLTLGQIEQPLSKKQVQDLEKQAKSEYLTALDRKQGVLEFYNKLQQGISPKEAIKGIPTNLIADDDDGETKQFLGASESEYTSEIRDKLEDVVKRKLKINDDIITDYENKYMKDTEPVNNKLKINWVK